MLFTSLVASDLFFVVFRIPMLYYLLTSNDPETFYPSFYYALYLAIGLISNVFIFVIFIVFNRVYRTLFYQFMACKYKRNQNSATVRDLLRNNIILNTFTVQRIQKSL